jgi:hypothetical protein
VRDFLLIECNFPNGPVIMDLADFPALSESMKPRAHRTSVDSPTGETFVRSEIVLRRNFPGGSRNIMNRMDLRLDGVLSVPPTPYCHFDPGREWMGWGGS